LAALASLVVSYFASYHLSDSLTSSGLFGQTAPWNRFAAMLTIYIVTGIIIWMGFRVISETIERIKLKDFDRQLGALFGLIKGVIFCVLITFFVVTLMPTYREQVINTRSGRYVAKLLNKADAIMPPELQTVLEPYLKRFEENMQPSNVAGADPITGRPLTQNPPGSNPQPWSAGMPNLPVWGNSGTAVNPGGSANPNAQAPFAGNVPGIGNPPNYSNNPPQPPGYNQPTFSAAGFGITATPGPARKNPYNGAGGQPGVFEPAATAALSATVPVSAIVQPDAPGNRPAAVRRARVSVPTHGLFPVSAPCSI
jgi:membrane protein required for colicin V production